jgi:hypothetical protein
MTAEPGTFEFRVSCACGRPVISIPAGEAINPDDGSVVPGITYKHEE